MTDTMKTRPKHTEVSEFAYSQLTEGWALRFEKKFRDLLRVRSLQVWIESNSRDDMTMEELLKVFIEKEILGK